MDPRGRLAVENQAIAGVPSASLHPRAKVAFQAGGGGLRCLPPPCSQFLGSPGRAPRPQGHLPSLTLLQTLDLGGRAERSPPSKCA